MILRISTHQARIYQIDGGFLIWMETWLSG